MKALCWHGKKDVRIDQVPDPIIINDRDAIIKVTTSAICGSDLHLYNALVPTLESGDVLGHEFMGEVVEVGKANKRLKIGERVVIPFTISCGNCFFCKQGLFASCDATNPNSEIAREMLGYAPCACFGYTHMLGGYAGGQSEYVRVPFADVGAIKIPDGVEDEKVLFLSDILPTGYMAAENAGIKKGDTVAVWGCGPVAQFTIKSAWMLGAGRVIAIDCVPERLKLAEQFGFAETINFEKQDVYETLFAITQGKGPDCCIDAVGCEAHAPSFDAKMDSAKVGLHIRKDNGHVLREMILCCRKAGHISIPGVYVDKLDSIPFGAAMNKGLTFKMGQTHVQKYSQKLLKKILDDEIDPSDIITHRINLDEVPEAYQTFLDKEDHCIKVVIKL